MLKQACSMVTYFLKSKANLKQVVDPEFRFDFLRKLGKIIINPFNLYNKYFLKTSDEFFKEDAQFVFNGKQVDIALVDGMHEYHFALRDVENILQYLDSDGIIIMHNCNPKSEEAWITFNQWKERGMSGTWNGDLWKTIVHLRTQKRH